VAFRRSHSSSIPMSQVSHNSIIQVFVQAFFLATFLDLHKDDSKPASRFQQNTLQKKAAQTVTSNSRSTPTITSLLQPFKMTPHHQPQIHYNKPLRTNYFKYNPASQPHSKSNPKNKKMCRVHYPEYLGCGCTFDSGPPQRYTLCAGAASRGEIAVTCTDPGLLRGANYKVKGKCALCKEGDYLYMDECKNSRQNRRRKDGGGGGGGKSGGRSSRTVR